MFTKRNLKIATAFLALVPVVSGCVGLMGVDDPMYKAMGMPRDVTLDSQMRFSAGVWLGAGLMLLWIAPRVDQQTAPFRFFWLMVFLGAIGRLLSLIVMGAPLTPPLASIGAQLITPPLLVWWQARASREN